MPPILSRGRSPAFAKPSLRERGLFMPKSTELLEQIRLAVCTRLPPDKMRDAVLTVTDAAPPITDTAVAIKIASIIGDVTEAIVATHVLSGAPEEELTAAEKEMIPVAWDSMVNMLSTVFEGILEAGRMQEREKSGSPSAPEEKEEGFKSSGLGIGAAEETLDHFLASADESTSREARVEAIEKLKKKSGTRKAVPEELREKMMGVTKCVMEYLINWKDGKGLDGSDEQKALADLDCMSMILTLVETMAAVGRLLEGAKASPEDSDDEPTGWGVPGVVSNL